MTTVRMLRHAVLALVSLATLLTPLARAQFTGQTPTDSPGLNIRRQVTTDPEILYPKDRELRLMSGDLMQVTVYGVSPDYTDTERVALDGTIRLNLGGVITVKGLSLIEAENAIAARFVEREMFVNPQVSVGVSDAPAHVVTFVGAVRGVAPVVSSKRLYDALAVAGGLTPTTSTVLSIDRPGVPEPIVIDLGNDPAHSDAGNVPVFAGDTVTTGTVGESYIVGAIKTPGRVPLSGSSPVTVMKAISAAGGPLFAAELDHTIIVRTTGSTRSVVKVPLKEILKGKAPDPVLQSEDILLVPSNTLKKIISSGSLLSTVSLAISLSSIFR